MKMSVLEENSAVFFFFPKSQILLYVSLEMMTTRALDWNQPTPGSQS